MSTTDQAANIAVRQLLVAVLCWTTVGLFCSPVRGYARSKPLQLVNEVKLFS